MVEQNIFDEFIDAIKPKEIQEKNKVYSAVIARIDEEGTVWVYVAGSDRETPTVASSSEVKRGDTVSVEWRNNKLYIAGNTSNPASGSVRVRAVEAAAQVANQKANAAGKAADAASQAANDAGQTAAEALNSASVAYEASLAQRYTYYAYAVNPAGMDFSLTDTSLQYRGICITTDAEAPTEPSSYKWEINPLWASKHAEKYLHDIVDGLAIYSEDLGEETYAGLSALALTFYLAGIQQMKVGYDATLQEYGVIAQTLLAAGSGAGVKFDNTSEASVRGRFVQEIRDNGHWTLKLY